MNKTKKLIIAGLTASALIATATGASAMFDEKNTDSTSTWVTAEKQNREIKATERKAEFSEKVEERKLNVEERKAEFSEKAEERKLNVEERKAEFSEKVEERKLNVEERKSELVKKRAELSEKRQEFRQRTEARVNTYKKLIDKKIGDRVEKMSDKQLEMLEVKVGKIIDRTESDDKMSDDRKENLLALFEWLQDIIDEKLFNIDDEFTDKNNEDESTDDSGSDDDEETNTGTTTD